MYECVSFLLIGCRFSIIWSTIWIIFRWELELADWTAWSTRTTIFWSTTRYKASCRPTSSTRPTCSCSLWITIRWFRSSKYRHWSVTFFIIIVLYFFQLSTRWILHLLDAEWLVDGKGFVSGSWSSATSTTGRCGKKYETEPMVVFLWFLLCLRCRLYFFVYNHCNVKEKQFLAIRLFLS